MTSDVPPSSKYLSRPSWFMSQDMVKPRNVSPTIRFFRYAALIAGIITARFKYNKYCQKELEYQNVRAQVNSEREIRDKVLTDYYDDLTQKRNEEEMEAFMAEVYEQ